jgi:hypothetical protein
METWRSQSSPAKQLALAIGCAAVGLALAIGFRHSTGSVGSDAFAGFLLGVLLIVIGVAALLTSGRQTVVVDPLLRRITVEDATVLRTKNHTIPFSDVASVQIGFMGKKSNFVSFYYLRLKLHSGKDFSLFAPGRFFPGASDRSVVEGWKRRLEGYLGQ